MSIQYLQDSRLNLIGFIETTPQGARTAYDKNRKRVGEFNPKANRTYDAVRRLVGIGDQLAMLIANSNRK